MVFHGKDELFQHIALGFAVTGRLGLIGRLIGIGRGQQIGIERLEFDAIRARFSRRIDKPKRGGHVAVMIHPRFGDNAQSTASHWNFALCYQRCAAGKIDKPVFDFARVCKIACDRTVAVHRQIGHQPPAGADLNFAPICFVQKRFLSSRESSRIALSQ